MPVPDPFREGMARGWKTHNGSQLTQDLTLEADVAIIGSGAGGGTTAEILSAAGYKVLLIEEGPLKTSSDFKLLEDQAYASLYQEGIGRMSKDGAITILQGRAVGGTTLINWTSSFRTPEPTLEHWAKEHNVKGHSPAEMAPWFEKMEQRLGVAPWMVPPNANNDVIRKGCEKLGYSWHVIPRNVRGCWNLGYCGMGCPTNAKQSMMVTTIPATLENGGELLYLARAEKLMISGDKVTGLQCVAMDERCVEPTGRTITVKARHYVLAGGGINSPALLLRSGAPDPHKRVGKRTFLHPVNMSAALFDEVVNPFYGAPQSIYSDHFQWQDGTTGKMAYKLEVPPLHPALADDAAGRFRPGKCATHGQSAAYPRHAGVAARRFSPGQPRWQRRVARRRHTGARLSGVCLCLGRFAPGLPQHGRDPVRRRCQGRDADARRRSLREHPRRSAHADRRPEPGVVPHAAGQCPCDGRLRDGRRPEKCGHRQPRPASSTGQSVDS